MAFLLSNEIMNVPVVNPNSNSRLIESIALEKERVEEGEDSTLPPYERIKKKLGNLPEEFQAHCGYDASAVARPPAAKRKADSNTACASKKTKATSGEVVDMSPYIQSNTVNKLKVDDLKAYLVSVGESTHGKKKDQLVQAVYDFFKIMK